jgi:predicted regulator of Ras-like GTPase activity (Roadblock/LC7/MglB family)
MSNLGDTLSSLMKLEGTLAAAVIDGNSGRVLGKTGSADGLDMAANLNTSVVRSKLRGIKQLEIQEDIEDILITSATLYHIVTFISAHPGLFIYTVLTRQDGNLGAARYASAHAQRSLQL